jgi:hypothetical protein
MKKYLIASAALFYASLAQSSDQAAYHVPVPEELNAYADFEIKNIHLKNREDFRLKYELPAELAGSRKIAQIDIRGVKIPTEEGFQVIDAKSHHIATCKEASSEELVCHIAYPSLLVEKDSALRAIESRLDLDEVGRAALADVMQIFSAEPQGVLTLKSKR